MSPRLALACLSLAALLAAAPALAQQSPTPKPEAAPPLLQQGGVAIHARIELAFRRGGSADVTLMQNNFQTVGVNATSEFIFSVLEQAAREGLDKALEQGATSGRITVLATGCVLGLSEDRVTDYAPIGVFINTTDLLVDADGQPRYRTRVQFVPDATQVPAGPSG